MRVSSVIDISLVDVPSIPVTVIFTGGCNFNCPYCQNASLIPRESGEEEDISMLVSRLDGFLSEGFCITGGEPTLHKDLPEFLKLLANQIGGHINLNTQGSIPSILGKSLPYLDSVWMDLKASPHRYKEVCRTKENPWNRVTESIQLIQDSDAEFWPRTTFVGTLMTTQDIQDIISFLERIDFSGKYTIQNYIASSGVREDEKKYLTTVTEDEMRSIIETLTPSFKTHIEWR